jgi:hypothetical protein
MKAAWIILAAAVLTRARHPLKSFLEEYAGSDRQGLLGRSGRRAPLTRL